MISASAMTTTVRISFKGTLMVDGRTDGIWHLISQNWHHQ
jgi:hypothetical protein